MDDGLEKLIRWQERTTVCANVYESLSVIFREDATVADAAIAKIRELEEVADYRLGMMNELQDQLDAIQMAPYDGKD